MFDWKLLAIIAPIFFVIYQAISKLLPKGTSIFLINAYAAFVGLIFMLILHFLLSPSKSLTLNTKVLPMVLGIGIFISLGNYGIIKAYNLGAPQSLFTPIFYVALIIYGVIFGLLIWQEKLTPFQILGIIIAITGLVMTVYFKK